MFILKHRPSSLSSISTQIESIHPGDCEANGNTLLGCEQQPCFWLSAYWVRSQVRGLKTLISKNPIWGPPNLNLKRTNYCFSKVFSSCPGPITWWIRRFFAANHDRSEPANKCMATTVGKDILFSTMKQLWSNDENIMERLQNSPYVNLISISWRLAQFTCLISR